jgi:long-chain acyl-CoA synthetase
MEATMSTTADAVRNRLTGPGGPFEITTETVDGVEMKVYAKRFPDLRTVLAFAAAHGPKELLVHGDRRITYTDFLAMVRSEAAHLSREAGVVHGDRVAVLSQNNPEWCATFWATISLGAVLVGLNGWWSTDEILYGLADSGAKVLVVDVKRLERIAAHLDEIVAERVYVVDADPTLLASHPKLHAFAELLASPDAPLPDVAIAEDDAAVIFYTSGTTGRPKGAVSSHRNMVANLQNTVYLFASSQARAAAKAAELGERAPTDPLSGGQPVALFASPLFHVSGCHSTLVTGVMAGVKLVMPTGRFDPVAALELIQREGVTMWTAVPTLIWRTCEHPARHDYDTSTVTSIAMGGSPSAGELQRRIRETFPNVRATSNGYGLTESSSIATVLAGPESLTRADSVGQALPVVDIAIAGPDGAHLAPGETGEILIRGPIVMKGYWNNPAATAATIRDGWLHSGDIGYLSPDGFLYVTDRAKDMIIRSGENIYCVEIENRLLEHPDILDAAVVGVPHVELGEEVKAIVQVAPGSTLTADAVRSWVAATLAPFKVPTHVELGTDLLPRNASGKLLKNVLRGTGDAPFDEML